MLHIYLFTLYINGIIISTLTLQHVKTAMDPTVRTIVAIDTVVHLVRHVTYRQEAVDIRDVNQAGWEITVQQVVDTCILEGM